MSAVQKRVVAEADNTTSVTPVVATYSREVVSAAIAGAVVGAVTVVAYMLLNRYVFGSVMCRAGADASCANAPSYAMAVSLVIGAVTGLVALVQARIFRPLLVVLATVISFWGLQSLVGGMVWYWAVVIGAVLFALAFLAFAWIARIRSFVLAVIVAIVLVLAIRLTLVS